MDAARGAASLYPPPASTPQPPGCEPASSAGGQVQDGAALVQDGAALVQDGAALVQDHNDVVYVHWPDGLDADLGAGTTLPLHVRLARLVDAPDDASDDDLLERVRALVELEQGEGGA